RAPDDDVERLLRLRLGREHHAARGAAALAGVGEQHLELLHVLAQPFAVRQFLARDRELVEDLQRVLGQGAETPVAVAEVQAQRRHRLPRTGAARRRWAWIRQVFSAARAMNVTSSPSAS